MRQVLFAILVLAASAATPSSAPAQAWAEKMFKDKDGKDNLTHNFGNVARGSQLYHRFKINNIYAVDMEITNVRTSCTCMTVTPSVKVLKPREEGYIEIVMDTRRFTGAKTVSIHISVGPQFTSTAELKVSAVSRADIVFNPGQANFGIVPRGQTPSQTVDVEYAGTLDWKILETVANEAPVELTLKEWYRRPGQVGYKVTIALKADAPAGTLKQEIFLKTNDPASPIVPLFVEGTIQAPLTVTPASVDLGTLKVGESKSHRVQVRGNKPFRIVSIEGLPDELTADFPKMSSTVCLIILKYVPTKSGPFKRTLQIKTDLDKDLSVSLTVEGKVVP
jgi:hypothetical protein